MTKFPWPKDNTAACIKFYGDPRGVNGHASAAWERENLVAVAVPWRMVTSWDKAAQVRTCRVHKLCASALDRVLKHVWEECGRRQDRINELGMNLYGGAYNFRVKRGLSSLSVHAFGAALDFDPERNGLGDNTPYMPRLVIDCFEAEGAVWGGNFRRKDGMHFQFATI